ncbi:MAG: hypothetical protein R3E84_08510 [Pseudomonadales bacterium]
MRLLLLTCLFVALTACQSAGQPADFAVLTSRIAEGNSVDVGQLQTAFAALTDIGERYRHLQELEEQALAIMVDEPLQLGAIGTAILDEYPGSLTGHMALVRFYEHLDSPEAAAPHQQWIETIRHHIETAAGDAEDPYRVTGLTEARAYLQLRGQQPVGGIYQAGDVHPLVLALMGRHENDAVETRYYALDVMYASLRQRYPAEPGSEESSALARIGILARESDSAAQASVGAFLTARHRTEDAIGWLRASASAGNIIANMLLAGIYREQIRGAENDEVREAYKDEILDNYTRAVALGSTDAMYALAVLYLNEQFGKENTTSGLPLLEQASALGHADSLTYLGHLYNQGLHVAQDTGKAAELFLHASELGNPKARYAYARLLVANGEGIAADERIVDWLQEQAKADRDTEAMVQLGNLYARGIATRANPRTAFRWYRSAVRANPADGNIVNEVAWTLAVSDIEGLGQPRYARTIMDSLMESDEEARQRPEYLDTWAAIHAANGEFERAVALQEEALERAHALDRGDVLEILDEHLANFRARKVIIERAP